MNILILSWRDVTHPLAGGAELVIQKHAEAWVKAGHKVTLFSSHFPGVKNYQTINKVRIIRKGYELLGVQIAAFWWYLTNKHPKYDLVIDQFHGIPFFSPIYVRTRKLAILQEVAKEVWLLNHLKKPLNIIVGVLGRTIEPFTFWFYRKVPFMTGSQSAKEDLRAFGIPEKNIKVIPHGVTINLPVKKYKKDKNKTILYLAALTRDKGIEEAIDVFKSLADKDSSYRFWIVGKGKGDYFMSIKKKVKGLGLRKKVKFWGYVDEVKKFELLERAHLLIHTSAREGWGLTVIESSYVGTPVIGFEVAGLKDSIKNNLNGFLVPYKDINKMAERCETLINDSELYQKISQTAVSYAKTFTWKKSTLLSLAYITNIVRKRILILNWKDIKHPEAGGAEKVTLEYAKYWVKRGFGVDWFASEYKDSKNQETINGVNIYRRGSQVFGVHLQAPFYYFKNGPYDLVIDQFHGIPFFTPLYVRVKKLAFIHEVAKEVWSLNPWPQPFNLIPTVIGTLLEPVVFKIFYRNIPFLTVSQSTRNDLISWGIKPDRITVIYNGVRVLRPVSLGKKEGNVTFIYLGVLTKDKGIEDAINCFGELEKSKPGGKIWKYWIVGKGEKSYELHLHKHVRELDLTDKIKFWGFVSENKKFELLSKAWVMINPSVREGWGLVNIEANAMRTPVVAYDVAGVRDSVLDNKTGYLSGVGDFRALAANASKLVENRNTYNTFCNNSLEWSEGFKWEKAQEDSLNLLGKVLKDIK